MQHVVDMCFLMDVIIQCCQKSWVLVSKCMLCLQKIPESVVEYVDRGTVVLRCAIHFLHQLVHFLIVIKNILCKCGVEILNVLLGFHFQRSALRKGLFTIQTKHFCFSCPFFFLFLVRFRSTQPPPFFCVDTQFSKKECFYIFFAFKWETFLFSRFFFVLNPSPSLTDLKKKRQTIFFLEQRTTKKQIVSF